MYLSYYVWTLSWKLLKIPLQLIGKTPYWVHTEFFQPPRIPQERISLMLVQMETLLEKVPRRTRGNCVKPHSEKYILPVRYVAIFKGLSYKGIYVRTSTNLASINWSLTNSTCWLTCFRSEMAKKPRTPKARNVNRVAMFLISVNPSISGTVCMVQSGQSLEGFNSSQAFTKQRCSQVSCLTGAGWLIAGLSWLVSRNENIIHHC